MAKTLFFKSCIGVFQGGGCRAAAFVGAYEEALKSGVSFTEVAGTSAGSIVASLIGAGATPKALRKAIAHMDFKSFVGTPDRRATRGISGRVLGMISPQFADLVFDQGLHSSLQIKNWIDEHLALLLPREKHPICFSSLLFPTYIVSTDIRRSEAKVWSQKTTPNELVADAVQASCAIPFFFQPVSRRYIDGGVLSNLPAFVFFDRKQSERPLASRVLAFTLIADEDDPREWDTKNFLRLLANAVVDGSQHLQLNLQSNVHIVQIPTGDIKATDFNRMTSEAVDTLIENGTNATRTFFEKELLQVQPTTSADSICYGTDELYTRTTESLELPLERVVIADHNTNWVYALFPSLLYWKSKGVRVDALLPELGDKEDGPYRRKLLRAMGVHLTELPSVAFVPIRSFVILPQDPAKLRAIVGVEKQSRSQTIEAVLYEGFMDESVIRTVLARLDELIGPYPVPPPEAPVFGAGSHDLLLDRIKSVGQYSKPGVDVTIENTPIEKLVSLTHFVREYKYRQIRHLVELYKTLDIQLFDPAVVMLNTGEKSFVTPPVVEESGGQFILIEGSTRAKFCLDEGISEIKCVVVRGVRDPLPSTPVPFERVRVLGRTLDPGQRYKGLNYADFRKIERSVHPLDSLA